MPSTVKDQIPSLLVRSAAVLCFTAASCLGLQAQQSAAPVPDAGQSPAQYPTLNLLASLKAPVSLDAASSSSSSSSSDADPVLAERANLAGDSSLQPPPRRRYGRPRYSDRMHNADGSNKLSVTAGGGFTVPGGNSRNVFTTSYAISAGVGYNFNKNFGIMGLFDYDHFGLNGNLINAQYNYYNNLGLQDSNNNPVSFAGLDGNAHNWTIFANPTYNVHQGDSLGFYITGGAGFVHKAVNFTTPQTAYFYSYYGAIPTVQNTNIDTHTANGAGVDFGGGVTWKPSHFAAAKLFVEARYVWADAKLSPEAKNPSPLSTLDNGSDSYVPVIFGIRW